MFVPLVFSIHQWILPASYYCLPNSDFCISFIPFVLLNWDPSVTLLHLCIYWYQNKVWIFYGLKSKNTIGSCCSVPGGWEFLQGGSCVLLTCPTFAKHFLVFWGCKMFQTSLVFFPTSALESTMFPKSFGSFY